MKKDAVIVSYEERTNPKQWEEQISLSFTVEIVRKLTATAYHPWYKSMAERMIRLFVLRVFQLLDRRDLF